MEQATLLPDLPARSRQIVVPGVANPVVKVLVDTPLPHLNHPLDYVLNQRTQAAEVGMAVTVRLGAERKNGWIVGRSDSTRHQGRLGEVLSVVGNYPVVTPGVYQTASALAHKYLGQCAALLREAIVPRHVRTEKEHVRRQGGPLPDFGADLWAEYVGGEAFLSRLRSGQSPRAYWQGLPGHFRRIGQAVQAVLVSGRSAVVVFPTTVQARQFHTFLGGSEGAALLVSERAASDRYRSFLDCLRGNVQVAVGTRSALWAPLADLGLIVVWDEGSDAYAGVRSPYVHGLQIATERAYAEKCGLLIGGFGCSVEAGGLVQNQWVVPLRPRKNVVRELLAIREAPAAADLAGDSESLRRLPGRAFSLLRKGLASGPVLVQTANKGYVEALACKNCRQKARCRACAGPLVQDGAGNVSCKWCARSCTGEKCPHCGEVGLVSIKVGARRTGEDLGKAFPGVAVTLSGGGKNLVPQVDDRPRIVIATAGAEPVAKGGYKAVIILDGAAVAGRGELWAPTEALRRWLSAAALASPEARVMLLGVEQRNLAGAFVRNDPLGWALEEWAERQELLLPPAVPFVAISGPAAELRQISSVFSAQDGVSVLGPTPSDSEEHLLLRFDRSRNEAVLEQLRTLMVRRSASKEPKLKLVVNPADLW
ncbi:MAG: primosomal protein N' [Actinomycetaceae bacterium]|nr:primosomal protein N' [Actinomycetaceae bacterium]